MPGWGLYQGKKGNVPYAVINLQGRVFMASNDDPFRTADQLLQKIDAKIIFVDFHAEATSEKISMGWYLDGRVTAVVGTHTHVPTADERVLPKGTAYVTDVGMTGPYDGVIGVKKELVVNKFLNGMPVRFEPATGDVRLCAVIVDCDETTGKARDIERLMLKLIPLSRKKLISSRSIDAMRRECPSRTEREEKESGQRSVFFRAELRPGSIQGTRHFWLSRESSTAG